MTAYLNAVFEDGDPALIAHALGVVARVEGMGDIAGVLVRGENKSIPPRPPHDPGTRNRAS
ncbi:MAG: hypothetical protein KGJ79_05965 [Alphaproteobacteria bacterium]|nr:hypothetical protein [Alphaproteobacteria bacterium]MDE2494473.1 hypothetical protein [Alphaproteobacteria bacterium]